MTDPEERLRALVQPVMRAVENGWSASLAGENIVKNIQIRAERAAILACARAQAEVLRDVVNASKDADGLAVAAGMVFGRAEYRLAAAEALVAEYESEARG